MRKADNSENKLPSRGMSGQEALSRLVEIFKKNNLGMAAGWLGQMGAETLDYAHDKQQACVHNQQQRMIGAVEILGAMQVIDEADTDTACGLILRIK